MISWTISVEPQWSSTALTHEYSSGGLFKQHYNEGAIGVPALSSALGVRDNNSTRITQNWSQTILQSYLGPDAQGDFSLNATTIKGTTNSTIENDARNSLNLITASTRNVTVLSTQASQTITTTTAERTRTTTQASTQNYQVYSTTSLNSEDTTYRTTTIVTSLSRSYKRTLSQTHTVEIDATTTTGSHLGGAYAATVYQANTRHASNANVIWVAAQSVVSDGIPQGAASDLATSTTRTTIWPVEATSPLSVFNNTETSATTYTNSRSSQNLAFTRTQNVQTVETFVLYDFAIPQITVTENGFSAISQETNVNNTVFSSNSFTAFNTSSATQTGISVSKLNDTQLGFAVDRTHEKTVSREITTRDTFWLTSGITTYTQSAPTAIWTTGSAQSDTQNIAGNAISQSTRIERGETTQRPSPWQATTKIASSARFGVEAVSGVRAPGNSILGYYGAEGIATTLFAEEAFVLASRNVQTAMPTSFTVYSNKGDLEELDLTEIGTASLSHLQGSATTTALDGTDTTSESFTFALVAEGQGTTLRARIRIPENHSATLLVSEVRNIVSCGGELGISETAYVTIPAGVYKDLSGATVSKSEEVASYTSGDGLQYLEPVTFFQTAATNSVSAIVWTSPRNSTARP